MPPSSMEILCGMQPSSTRRITVICFASIFCAVLYLHLATLGVASSTFYEQQLRVGTSENTISILDGDIQSAHEISFRFQLSHPGEGPLRNASMGLDYRCTVGTSPNGINRTSVLPSELQQSGLFDFSTAVKSNKRILFIGDSVAQQLSETFDESLSITKSWSHHKNEVFDDRTGYRRGFEGYKDGNKEIISFSSPTNGGGSSSYWRMTDIWTAENEGKNLPPHTGGGWSQHQVKVLCNQLLKMNKTTTLDAIIMNYNNWIIPDPTILEMRYRSAIHLAQSIFKTKAIIFVTYPFTKTVNSTKRWNDVYEYNNMIRRISAENNRNVTSITTTVVLEFGNLTNQLLWTNARSLGLNVSDPREVSSVYGWELQDNVTNKFKNTPTCPVSASFGKLCLHMPVMCAKHADEDTDCLRNYISFDDMHWCTETIGARWSAGIACLLGCVFNSCNGQTTTTATTSTCEAKCNEQFMTLTPISNDWIHSSSSWLSSCS